MPAYITVAVVVGRREKAVTAVVLAETKRRKLVRLPTGVEIWANKDARKGEPYILRNS